MTVEIEIGLENAAKVPHVPYPEEELEFHQAQLMEHVNKMNPAFGNMTNGTAMKLIAHGSSLTKAAAQAQGMVYGLVQKQAAMMAFLDNFKFLGIVFFAVIPILLLMKKPRVLAGGVPVH